MDLAEPQRVSEPDRYPEKKRLYEQGRVMGGGSSVNVQSANRGLPRDYDCWAKLGASGWGWDDVLPYFKKVESDQDFDGPLHGRDGPLPIRRIFREQWPAFARQISSQLSSRGFADLDDQNGEFGDGMLPPTISNINGRRVSAAMAYPTLAVRRRPNLTIMSRTRADRLLFDGPRATGVRTEAGGAHRDVHGQHIIVTAGALRSPALLMRAGIGSADALRKLNIEVIADRRGVGQNQRDHPPITTAAYLPRQLRLDPELRRPNHAVLRISSGDKAPPSICTSSPPTAPRGTVSASGLGCSCCGATSLPPSVA
ncbi:choline dehydrogenase-like flavoprotein [Nitrobacteraceae bacterium AZCC 2146]